jgi:hypothetical protein
MPTKRIFDTTPPGTDLGEMKIFPRSQESERLMLVNAIIRATNLVNKHARKAKPNGKTLLEEAQEKLTSSLTMTKRTTNRLGEVRRMGHSIFSPHIMHNRSNTQYSDIFLATYWNQDHTQPLYDAGTPQQSNKNKEKESTLVTNTENDEADNSTNEPDQLDEANTEGSDQLDEANTEESIDEESIESYNFDDDDESMTRQKSLFSSYDAEQTDAISQLMTQFQEADDVNEPNATSTKEDVTDEDQPSDGSPWQLTDQDELLRILSERIDAMYKPTITNLETRVTQEQQRRTSMETTLNTIQASITSTEIEQEEQKANILTLQKIRSTLDRKTKTLTKNQQRLEETMVNSQTLLDEMETRHSALEDKTLKIEKRITEFTKKLFEKEHQRFTTHIKATTATYIEKLKTEGNGLKKTQLMAQERHNQTIIKQGIETLHQQAEKKQDETLDLLDLKANELEELSRQTLDAIPGYIQEELQHQVAIMKTVAATEIEHHGKTITLDIKRRMQDETIFIELKEDLHQSIGSNLKQHEQRIQAETKKNISEFIDLVAQRKMDFKSVASTHKTNIQSTAVTELQNFKKDIQLAAAALIAKAAQGTPNQPISNDESSANNEYPEDDIYDTGDYEQHNTDTRRGHPHQQPAQSPSRWQNARAMSTTSHLENFDNKVRITRATTKLNSIDATQLYNYLSDKMITNQLPINDIDDLKPRGSCIPQNAESEIGRDTLQNISKVLYRKIHDKIGDDDQHIKAIVDNHSIERDGYKTLYDIMRHFQQHLQDIPMVWGPTWQEKWSPRVYVTNIKQQVQQESKMDNRTRSEQEQVIEMVLQSQKISKYSSTTGALMMQLALHGRSEAFKNLELSQLATMFDNATQTTNKSITNALKPGKPSINKFNASSQGPTDRYTSREPREKIQCNLCTQFGHSQSKGQVCRDAAKIYWIVKDLGLLPQSANQPPRNAQDLEKQLAVYKQNAKLFKQANEIYPKIKTMWSYQGLTEEQEMDIVYQIIKNDTEADTTSTENNEDRREEEPSQDFL